MPENVTEQGDRVLTLWQGSWVAALAVGVPGLGPDPVRLHLPPQASEEEADNELPPQVRYNLPIEMLYTVVPIVMVAVFFYFTARDETTCWRSPRTRT